MFMFKEILKIIAAIVLGILVLFGFISFLAHVHSTDTGAYLEKGWYVDPISKDKIELLTGETCFEFMDRVDVGKMDSRIYVPNMDYETHNHCWLVDTKDGLKLYSGKFVKDYYVKDSN